MSAQCTKDGLGECRRRTAGRSRRMLAALLGVLCANAFSVGARGADIIRGKTIYGQQCALCHGANGMAVQPGAPDFARGDRLLQPDVVLLARIRAGKGTMPGFQGIMPDRDILSVIAYLRTMQ